MTRTEIITLQRQLKAAGYHITRIDGIYGPETATAYQAWLDYNTPKTLPTPAPKPVTPWWRHKVVLGLLATVLAGITARWGVDSNELLEILLKLTEVAGLLLAAWGTAPSRASGVDPGLVLPGMRLPTRTDPVSAQRAEDKSAGPFGY